MPAFVKESKFSTFWRNKISGFADKAVHGRFKPDGFGSLQHFLLVSVDNPMPLLPVKMRVPNPRFHQPSNTRQHGLPLLRRNGRNLARNCTFRQGAHLQSSPLLN
jgi:hypothetical protein